MLLAFDDNGPGRVVVLLHGFPLDRTMWSAQVGTVGSVYRLITPDLRGHGDSAAPDDPVYTVDAMADDVMETLDALAITERVVVGGLSMGGYVALSIAARYPDRIRGLMLMNTRAAGDTESTARVREDIAREVETAASSKAVVETMLPKLFAPATAATRPEQVARIAEQMARTTPHAVAATLRGLAVRPDRTADLPRIAVPTLVIAGIDDQLIPAVESHGMAATIPDATLVEVPDAGHLAPVENPAAVNDAVLRFLTALGD